MSASKKATRIRSRKRTVRSGELQALRRWYLYNAALRPMYLRAIQRLPPRTRHLNDGASYPLFEIFLHVLDAYRWWFRYVYRDVVPELGEWERVRLRGNVRTPEIARREMTRTTRDVLRFVNRLKEEDLGRMVFYSAPNDDWTGWRKERITLRSMLWHMVEEELQHRGEMNALLWRHGVEPPIVEYHAWSKEWTLAK
jgi:uncharacterized damage-inducible protein DinB